MKYLKLLSASLSFLLCSTIIYAETGIKIYDKEGKMKFIPSEEIGYVEFVNDYAHDVPDTNDQDWTKDLTINAINIISSLNDVEIIVEDRKYNFTLKHTFIPAYVNMSE